MWPFIKFIIAHDSSSLLLLKQKYPIQPLLSPNLIMLGNTRTSPEQFGIARLSRGISQAKSLQGEISALLGQVIHTRGILSAYEFQSHCRPGKALYLQGCACFSQLYQSAERIYSPMLLKHLDKPLLGFLQQNTSAINSYTSKELNQY